MRPLVNQVILMLKDDILRNYKRTQMILVQEMEKVQRTKMEKANIMMKRMMISRKTKRKKSKMDRHARRYNKKIRKEIAPKNFDSWEILKDRMLMRKLCKILI